MGFHFYFSLYVSMNHCTSYEHMVHYSTTWVSPEVTNSMSLDGSVARYGGGGYRVILSNEDEEKVKQDAKGLRYRKWFDRATRAILLEFVVYNGNINLFCIFKLVKIAMTSHFNTLLG